MFRIFFGKLNKRPNSSRIFTALQIAGLFFVGILGAVSLPSGSASAQYAAGINQTINYQGRLLTATGAVVPDGTYNMEFKLYQDGDGTVTGDTAGSTAGSLKWTEDWVYGTGGVNDKRIVVKNGYFSVSLGSITSLSAVNFNWDTIWLSTNIGNVSTATTFSGASGDGEMLPMKRLAANPYALNSGMLGGLTSSQFVQLGQGIQAVSSTVAAIGTNQSGTGNILDLQKGGADVQLINNSGQTLFRPTVDSQTALQVQKAGSSTVVFTVDSTNTRIGIGTGTPAYAVDAVGSVNASVSLKVAGTDVCTSTGCTVDPTTVIKNQNSAQQVSSNYWISGTGRADTSLLSPTLDTASAVTLNIGANTANQINIGRSGQQTAIGGELKLTGTDTTTANYRFQAIGNLNSSATGSQYGFDNEQTFNPSGASLGAIYGFVNSASINGSSLTIPQLFGSVTGVSTTSGFTGTASSVYGFNVSSPVIGGPNKFSSYIGISVAANSANGGNTTGSILNTQLGLAAITAGAGAGGNLTNYALNIVQPSGTGGNTSNYGINLTGSGASSGTGVNYSINNASSAASYYAGSVGLGNTAAVNPLAINGYGTGTFTDAQLYLNANGAANRGIVIQESLSTTANALQVVSSTGTTVSGLRGGGGAFFGSSGPITTATVLSTITGSATNVGLGVQGSAGQSVNLAEFKDPNGSIQASFSASAQLTLGTATQLGTGSSAVAGVLSLSDASATTGAAGKVGSITLAGNLASNQSYLLPVTGGTICLTSGNCNAAGGYIVNSTSLQASSNFNISGTGQAATSFTAPLFDVATAGSLSIGTGGIATSIGIGSNLINTTIAASAVALNTAAITTNASTLALFNTTATTVNTFGAATSVTVGATSGTFTIQNPSLFLGGSGPGNIVGAGNAGLFLTSAGYSVASSNSGPASFKTGLVSGATSNSGSTSIRTGNSTSSGNTGSITLLSGDANNGQSGDITIDNGLYTTGSPAITIGNSTQSHTVSIASGGSVTQSVTLGSLSSASATIIQGGTGNVNLVTTGATAGAIIKNTTGSASAFQVQNSSSAAIFTADTSNNKVLIPVQTIIGGFANQSQLIVKANASQTGNNPLFSFQNSSGTELGRLTMDSNNNTNLGFQSGTSNTTGFHNTSVGSGTLGLTTTGGDDVAFGYNSQNNNTTGYGNTSVGSLSLGFNTTGTYNTILGYSAGSIDSAGYFKTGATIQNASAIGAYAQVQQNNSIVLGSIDTPTNIGIGTTIPANLLSVSPVAYQAGTVIRTNGSTGIVGTGTTWTSTMVGQTIIFADGASSVISAVVDATHITMSTSFAGATDGSGVRYRIHSGGFQVTSAGNAFVQNSSSTAFQVQNNIGSNVLSVDTTNNVLSVTAQSGTTGGVSVVTTGTNAITNQIGLNVNNTASPTASSNASAQAVNGFQYSSSANASNMGLFGGLFGSQYDGVNQTNQLQGVYGFASYNGTGAANIAIGLTGQAQNTSTGTLSNANGLRAYSATNSGGGTITNSYGVYVENQSAGINDYGVYIQGADTNALYVNSGSSFFGGNILQRPSTNSATAFSVQNNSSAAVLTADTNRSVNLITNPGFETGVTGWTATGGAGATTQTTTVANTNFGVAALTYATTGSNQGVTTSSFTGTVPAGIYNVSFYMMTSSNLVTASLSVNLNDGSNHLCSPLISSSNSTFVSNTNFSRVYCQITTTANLNSLIITQTDLTSRTNYIDGVQLELANGSGQPTAYRIGGVAIRGVVETPLVVQSLTATGNAFQVLSSAAGSNLSVLRVDSINNTVVIGSDAYAGGNVTYGTGVSQSVFGSSTMTLTGGTSATLNAFNTGASQTINIGGGSLSSTNIASGDVAHTVGIGAGGSTTAQTLTLGSTSSTSTTLVQGGNGGGAVSLQTGSGGTVVIGTTIQNGTVTVGSTTLSSGTQTINLGATNVLGGTTNVNIGSGVNSTGGTTTVTAKGALTLTGNAASTWSTSAGSLTINGGSTLTLQSGSNNTFTATATGTGNTVLGSGGTGVVTVGGTGLTGLGINLVAPTYSANERGVTIGTADANITLLDLDQSSTITNEVAANCTTSVNAGGLYYNSNVGSGAIRACVNGSWEDIVTTAGLGILLYGVVPDSGTNPGDLVGIVGTGTGPCKVIVGSTNATGGSSVSWSACTAYSGGRKVVVSAATNQATSANATIGNVEHLCLTGTNSQPALLASSAENAGFPAFAAGSPVLCIADIKFGAANQAITAIYDTRTFTTAGKHFANVVGTAPALGTIVTTNGTTSGTYAYSSTTPGIGKIQGIVVASAGTTTVNTINAVIATDGPGYVRATAATINDYVENGTAAGYAVTANTAPTNVFSIIGLAQSAISTTCTVSADACRASIFTIINIR